MRETSLSLNTSFITWLYDRRGENLTFVTGFVRIEERRSSTLYAGFNIRLMREKRGESLTFISSIVARLLREIGGESLASVTGLVARH
jgi:hypothetical protein